MNFLNKFLNRLYNQFDKRTFLIGAVVIIILVGGGIVAGAVLEQPAEEIKDKDILVRVSSIKNLAQNGSISLVGTVEAIDEVRLESETSGRVTRVFVNLGQQVGAGTTIATIENASEYAALLQAEGAYEAAVASAASSNVGLSEAKNNAVDVYRDTYSEIGDTFVNTIDLLFTNPRATTPGLKVNAGIKTDFLNNERYAFNAIIENFQKSERALSKNDDLEEALDYARSITSRTQDVVDVFIEILPKQLNQEQGGIFSQTELETLQSSFTVVRQSLNSAISEIDSAKELLRRAEIASTGKQVSSADASVKQALGVLRAAEANYAKTIIRTPISGTVNSLSVKTGDYVSLSQPVAIVANNNALLITTFISEQDRGRVVIGDSVEIEGQYEGKVTNIAPAVDPVTKKIEIKIQTDTSNLLNGDTVGLVVLGTQSETENSDEIKIPITALKAEPDRMIVFTVNEQNILEAHEVEVGQILGDRIVILEGVTSEMEIVLDARGLNEGDSVKKGSRE